MSQIAKTRSRTRSRSRTSRSRSRSRGRSRSPKSTTEQLAHQLQIEFPELTIEVESVEATSENAAHDYIHGFACSEKSKCECFGLQVFRAPNPYIHIDRIRYKYAEDCKLSGTYVLTHLTSVIRTVDIPRVQMYDAARIHVMVDGEPQQFKLSTYHILLHGESWYNRYGYRSDTYEHERIKNQELGKSNMPPGLVKAVNEALEGVATIEKKTTFHQFAVQVDESQKDPSVSTEIKTKYLRAYLLVDQYLDKHKKIKYAYYDLSLR